MQSFYKGIIVIIIMMITIYVGLCCHILRHKAPLEFAADVETSARADIESWYGASEEMRQEPFGMEALLYAVFHPQQPHRYRPSVSILPLGGGDAVQVSCRGNVATFAKDKGKWELVALEGWR